MCAISVSRFPVINASITSNLLSVALRTIPVLVARGDEQGRRESPTMLSWKSPFIGKAHKALYATISNVCTNSARHIYARFLDVIQSSGMGKSRMIDELSKEHFVIPINVRTTGTGFPPADYVVSKFLVHAPFTPDDASRRAQAFLISLFEITAKTIPDLDRVLEPIISKMLAADRPTSNAQKFRLFMTYGQSSSQPGRLRKYFYDKVIRRAKFILEPPLKANSIDMEITESEHVIPMDTDDKRNSGMESVVPPQCATSHVCTEEGKPLSLHQSALELINVLAPDMPLTFESLQLKPPLIILAYDEAHGLSFPKNEDKPTAPTAHSQHRQVIRGLRKLPIFSLFLSTTGKVHDHTPPPKYYSSDRLMILTLRLLAPFSALGFDQMVKAHPFTADGQNFGINDVSKVGFMVLFGRPLWGSRYENGSLVDKGNIVQFARQKLMPGEDLDSDSSSSAKLALMSVRLALHINKKVQTL
ncbi:hypothetical protein M378DRAFT_357000 [Amanita muscaria Koide BX008]|uniref:Uncharacterized protein n=1 Tax=Amanita muscaria (strain Koide BX008) TaxID=946122 RepID=A0A0C2W9J8_AMAMK|nr:hypothetical protein M378DRAFT_357000 [Amanita muscaria Koide BX008]